MGYTFKRKLKSLFSFFIPNLKKIRYIGRFQQLCRDLRNSQVLRFFLTIKLYEVTEIFKILFRIAMSGGQRIKPLMIEIMLASYTRQVLFFAFIA
ncbi:UNKNOWN [Stylonychia lemnae]|uniref:Uncharacterized protein n=1 Tax=Stylonychia lemnae TaxID=5949 RepID=A0A077ZT24_STYLE|nr:UNKNOWN [Stylonychia lemnae]|eukprot:CDW71621.1 UNKNOWN [Stylonychia lemnae]